jgi:hypothetical protein
MIKNRYNSLIAKSKGGKKTKGRGSCQKNSHSIIHPSLG